MSVAFDRINSSTFAVDDKQNEKGWCKEAVVNRSKNKTTETLLRGIWREKLNPKAIENLSLEDLEEVLGDFYTELK